MIDETHVKNLWRKKASFRNRAMVLLATTEFA